MRDIDLNATEDFKTFSTRVDTGAPADITSVAVSAYPDNSTTEITAGITVTNPFDSRTGLTNTRVVATVANGYAYNSTYALICTTGTVNSISVVGAIMAETFTIGKNRPCLVRMGVCQSSTTSNIVLDTGATAADNFYNGHLAYISAGTGAGQSRFIDSWTSSTHTGTVSPNWTTAPDTTSVFQLYSTPPASTGAPVPANVTQLLGTAWLTPGTAGTPDVNVKLINAVSASAVTTIKAVQGLTTADTISALGAGTITATSIAADAITAAKVADGTIDAATFAAGAIDATAIATDAIGASEFSNAAALKVATQAMTEAYAADGATMTIAQALYLIIAHLGEKSVSSTTVTLHKLDGSTSAATFTLDSALAPTSITRAT